MEAQAVSEQSINLVINLFEDWQRMFGKKLQDRQHLDLRTAELWALALRNERLTLAEFKEATARSLNMEWPPTAAADLVKLVRGDKQSKYPSTQTAFNIACRNCGMRGEVDRDWKHPVILETANRLGWGVLAQATNGFIKHFEKVYEAVVLEHQGGANFTIPEARRIEPPKPVKLDDNSKVAQEWNALRDRTLGKRGGQCER